MKKVFGVKKDKGATPSIQDATDRINKRGDTVDEKLKKLDAELCRYKEQIKRTRPGPTQEAIKARAMRVLKQKRMYEGQRDMLYNQTFNLDQVAFASEGLKDAQHTMSALKSANTDLKGIMKTMKIQDIDNLQDEMMDMMDMSNEIQETLGISYNVPDDIDEDELMGGLNALAADMGSEADGIPSYLQPDKEEPDLDAELNLPSAPSGYTAAPAGRSNAQDNLFPCSFSQVLKHLIQEFYSFLFYIGIVVCLTIGTFVLSVPLFLYSACNNMHILFKLVNFSSFFFFQYHLGSTSLLLSLF
ncbi:vacuolar protein sorting-associated protein 60.2-like isoform X1 [Durio zibethinus]|uniref:Vacuolar protein sorting-associated protein 60.2-like isoform X1 n=1 Tax=Durio zibethinus TaxID=66656 RepID=A0A6P6AL40_DURZI|nr:vacuolar protein sorting-associated protein 60.2-like isoform X1 [Durio zibethinus]